jgi:hypothetical protein
MRKRLEELNWRTQRDVSHYGDHADGIDLGVLDSESREIVSTPFALKTGKRVA